MKILQQNGHQMVLITQVGFRLPCQPARRPTGRAKPLIGHKLDTGWQGRLYLVQVSDLVALKQLIYTKENTYAL